MFELQRHWYHPTLTYLTILLLPFSWAFRLVSVLRSKLYSFGFFKVYRAKVPVIVVGNLTVGGTGKTPLVIHLAESLQEKGYKPGVVMRGYGGIIKNTMQVTENSRPNVVGDEAVLLFNRLDCPIVVGRCRVGAVKYLEETCGCDVILSDDGLQHYALGRDVEIVVIDGMRRLGNQRLLPAGPLREHASRMASVDFVVVNGEPGPGEVPMHMQAAEFVSVADNNITKPLDYFKGKRVHAVAGIGNPDRFFTLLSLLGCEVSPHAFPDHYSFSKKDIDQGNTVIMTEKDAVKCTDFAAQEHWFLRINADVDAMLLHTILTLIKRGSE